MKFFNPELYLKFLKVPDRTMIDSNVSALDLNEANAQACVPALKTINTSE